MLATKVLPADSVHVHARDYADGVRAGRAEPAWRDLAAQRNILLCMSESSGAGESASLTESLRPELCGYLHAQRSLFAQTDEHAAAVHKLKLKGPISERIFACAPWENPDVLTSAVNMCLHPYPCTLTNTLFTHAGVSGGCPCGGACTLRGRLPGLG